MYLFYNFFELYSLNGVNRKLMSNGNGRKADYAIASNVGVANQFNTQCLTDSISMTGHRGFMANAKKNRSRSMNTRLEFICSFLLHDWYVFGRLIGQYVERDTNSFHGTEP